MRDGRTWWITTTARWEKEKKPENQTHRHFFASKITPFFSFQMKTKKINKIKDIKTKSTKSHEIHGRIRPSGYLFFPPLANLLLWLLSRNNQNKNIVSKRKSKRIDHDKLVRKWLNFSFLLFFSSVYVCVYVCVCGDTHVNIKWEKAEA